MALKTMKVKGFRWSNHRGTKKWFKHQMTRWLRRQGKIDLDLPLRRRFVGYVD